MHDNQLYGDLPAPLEALGQVGLDSTVCATQSLVQSDYEVRVHLYTRVPQAADS